MTTDQQRSAGSDDNVTKNAGPSTDQHVTGRDETEPFATDEPPTSGTPAHGSSNIGINKLGANREQTS
jgi:hypothetical protein